LGRRGDDLAATARSALRLSAVDGLAAGSAPARGFIGMRRGGIDPCADTLRKIQ